MQPHDDIALIISTDATAAALLGGLVETLGWRVRFDTPAAADRSIARARPSVLVLDCESEEACSEAIIARAMMRGIGVVLIGSRALVERMRELSSRHGVEMHFTPPSANALGDQLRRAAGRVA